MTIKITFQILHTHTESLNLVCNILHNFHGYIYSMIISLYIWIWSFRNLELFKDESNSQKYSGITGKIADESVSQSFNKMLTQYLNFSFFLTHKLFKIKLTLFVTGLKIYVKHSPPLNTQNHCEKPNFFAYQIGHQSYRNRKSHEIRGCLEAILRVLGLIYTVGRGVFNTPPTENQL